MYYARLLEGTLLSYLAVSSVVATGMGAVEGTAQFKKSVYYQQEYKKKGLIYPNNAVMKDTAGAFFSGFGRGLMWPIYMKKVP